MNVNDRNGLLRVLHQALTTRKTVMLDNPGVMSDDIIRVAEELKVEHPQFEPVRLRKVGSNRIALELGDRQPALVDCPECGTHIALLSSELYKSTEGEWTPGDMKDEEGRQDAMFAIVDAEGHYTCPNPECQRPGTVEPVRATYSEPR